MKGVIAFGMTMVIISGQIDLSIGSVVALSGVIAAWSCENLPAATGMSVDAAAVIGMIAALLFAVLLGMFHGFAQVKFKMPAFIITLATQQFLYGLAGLICGGFPIAGKMPNWFNQIGIGRVGSIPIPAIVCPAISFSGRYISAHFVLYGAAAAFITLVSISKAVVLFLYSTSLTET